jgi:acyl-CoA thioesterase FadM
MEYCLVSHRLNAVAADGSGTIVTFNYADGKKAAVPEEIRQRIGRLESRTL